MYLNGINQIIFLMDKGRVVFEVGTIFVNIIYMNYLLQTV
jgi:hypothetical protein